MPSRPLDPAAPLTLARAARAAGVDEAELRERMASGELLFESPRRGKDEVLVRAVDLATVYPGVRLKGRPAAPTPPRAAGRPASSARGTARARATSSLSADDPSEGATSASAASVRPSNGSADAAHGGAAGGGVAQGGAEQVAPASPLPTPTQAGAPTPDPQATSVISARLDALESTNRDLRGQLDDLRGQRTDLVTQCDDLRQRLDRAERERQASTAGLMLAQKRLLELEAPVVAVDPPWRRRALYGLGAAVLVLAFFLRQQVVHASALSEDVRGLAADLDDRDQQLGDLGGRLPALTSTLEDLDAELARTRREAREDRGALLEALSEERAARDAGARSSRAELEVLRSEHAAAERALVDERDALRGELEQREAALAAAVATCLDAVEELARRPMPRAATGFVGRIVERLDTAREAAGVSQDAPGDG